ncbi:MAG: GerMN domain-containing protein [Tissierellia bacterium]|nr:GerMN domain-containing protein [Tissierellia bacterium]
MKKYIAGLLILIMIFTLAACTSEGPKREDINVGDSHEDNVEDEDTNNTEDNNEEEPIVEDNEEEITLYFSNNEYIETGNENLDKVLPEKRIIEYKNMELEEAIVRELLKGPESMELSTSIPDTVELLGVKVKDKTAFVNFSESGLNGGSLQEDLTIRQIVESLVELDSVDKVQFLINGEESESLMGHFDITEPFRGNEE